MSALLGAVKGLKHRRKRRKKGMPGKRRRRRGISGAELRGFFKVAGLLASVGMRAHGLARPFRRRHRGFFGRRRRFGDPEPAEQLEVEEGDVADDFGD